MTTPNWITKADDWHAIADRQSATINKLEHERDQLRAENEGLKQKLSEYSASYDNLMAVRNDEKQDVAKRLGYPGWEPYGAADFVMKQLQSLTERNGEIQLMLRKLHDIYEHCGRCSLTPVSKERFHEIHKLLTPQPPTETKS